jgi:hypothetical protein
MNRFSLLALCMTNLYVLHILYEHAVKNWKIDLAWGFRMRFEMCVASIVCYSSYQISKIRWDSTTVCAFAVNFNFHTILYEHAVKNRKIDLAWGFQMRFEMCVASVVCYSSCQISKIRWDSTTLCAFAVNFNFHTISPNHHVPTTGPTFLLDSWRGLGFSRLWVSLLSGLRALVRPLCHEIECYACVGFSMLLPSAICSCLASQVP